MKNLLVRGLLLKEELNIIDFCNLRLGFGEIDYRNFTQVREPCELIEVRTDAPKLICYLVKAGNDGDFASENTVTAVIRHQPIAPIRELAQSFQFVRRESDGHLLGAILFFFHLSSLSK